MLDFDKMNGPLPAIIQDTDTAKVLILGFILREAYAKTVETGRVTCFSRSKNRLRAKGERSANFLSAVSIKEDCDKDTLLIQLAPAGSYMAGLFESGVNKMAQKMVGEAVETVVEACNGTDERLIYEKADMLYYLILLLTSKGYRLEELTGESEDRHYANWKKYG